MFQSLLEKLSSQPEYKYTQTIHYSYPPSDTIKDAIDVLNQVRDVVLGKRDSIKYGPTYLANLIERLTAIKVQNEQTR